MFPHHCWSKYHGAFFYTKNKNKKYYLKRKKNENSINNIQNKKCKLYLENVEIKDNEKDNKNNSKKIKININRKRKNGDKNIKYESYLGEMSVKCEFCSAVFWKEEQKKNNCCHRGKIILSPLSKDNENLKKLLLFDKIFRSLIRYYNNLFCFATFSTNVKNEKTKGIYNLKIQGQVCHTTPNTLINKDNNPTCGQLYIYDNMTSIEKRLKANENLVKEHIEILTDILNDNPYAKKYKYLHQLANIKNIPDYRLYFLRKNDKQQHRYNKPLTSECGAIIISKSVIPEDYDLCVYPKHDLNCQQEFTYLNKLSHHVDPMVFPLMFPSGDLGWSTNYKKDLMLPKQKN